MHTLSKSDEAMRKKYVKCTTSAVVIPTGMTAIYHGEFPGKLSAVIVESDCVHALTEMIDDKQYTLNHIDVKL